MKKLLVFIPAVLLLCACGTERANDVPPTPEKPAASSGPTGRIRGVVRLIGNAPAQTFEQIKENQNVCGDRTPLSRLDIGKEKGVRHAFVYLDGVQSTEGFHARESLLVDQKNCQYAPHALIV